MTKAAVPRAVVRLSKSLSLVISESDTSSWALLDSSSIAITLSPSARKKLLAELIPDVLGEAWDLAIIQKFCADEMAKERQGHMGTDG